MKLFLILAMFGFSCLSVGIAHGELLTVGSPTPKFAPIDTVRGEHISELAAGKGYVIEFSGTTCGPCIKAIPLMEDLINKHGDLTFIAVFSEPEADVRSFVKRAGKEMTSHIAIDDGTITRDWLAGAAVPGIPWVFVVGKDGNVAWMGQPDDLAKALSAIDANGKIDREDAVSIVLQQHAFRKDREESARRSKADDHFSKVIVKLINEGKHTEAVNELERSSIEFHDLPDVVERFQLMKFYQMSRAPGTRDAAYNLALDLAIAAKGDEQMSFASTLLQHYETALPENKNLDMVFLAANLLKEPPSSTESKDETLTLRRNYYSACAKANTLLGREEAARESLQRAVGEAEELVTLRKKAGDHEVNIAGSERILNQLKGDLVNFDESIKP